MYRRASWNQRRFTYFTTISLHHLAIALCCLHCISEIWFACVIHRWKALMTKLWCSVVPIYNLPWQSCSSKCFATKKFRNWCIFTHFRTLQVLCRCGVVLINMPTAIALLLIWSTVAKWVMFWTNYEMVVGSNLARIFIFIIVQTVIFVLCNISTAPLATSLRCSISTAVTSKLLHQLACVIYSWKGYYTI